MLSISVPYASKPLITLSNNVVPLPENGSKTIPFSTPDKYFLIAHLGISGIKRHGYLKNECVYVFGFACAIIYVPPNSIFSGSFSTII